MSRFLVNTLSDIRGGRESWRVLTVASTLSFAIAIVVRMAHLF